MNTQVSTSPPTNAPLAELGVEPTGAPAAPFTVEVVERTTQKKRTWRLTAAGPAAEGARAGGATLQETIVQRLRDTRGLSVERVVDGLTGVPLLPCYSSAVIASLFPQLRVDVSHRVLPEKSARTGAAVSLSTPMEQHGRRELVAHSDGREASARQSSQALTWEKALRSANADHYGLHRSRATGVAAEETVRRTVVWTAWMRKRSFRCRTSQTRCRTTPLGCPPASGQWMFPLFVMCPTGTSTRASWSRSTGLVPNAAPKTPRSSIWT
ncbi:hypothetical protein STCU_11003 [Strigomonas culicis]|uniref:Uncharacterized protein n=1 Tax=Strigomonas culicis TaxID=28005 RepID=S9TIQ6_9TRYP|nr:hypothetical protein STCU_11003 [Strigomonas culicis]|eukprot:EPY16779.1 hypothetical protein STCU_11003 [Strigomonas culicis]